MKKPRRPRSGLPRGLERLAAQRYGRGRRGRVALAAGLRALWVLLRRHPGAAADMAGAAVVAAGQAGVEEVKDWLAPASDPQAAADDSPAPAKRPAKGLRRRERRRLLRALDADAARDAAPQP